MTNAEIVEKNFGLLTTCMECQFSKASEKDKSYYEDFFQEICLILLEYDNAKLNKIVEDKHLNAFITRIIQNNLFSKTSPFYKKYKKLDDLSQEITKKELNIPDDF